MKLTTFLLVAVMNLFSMSAFAQFFQVPARVNVFPLQVSVEFYNPYYEPIICDAQVHGQTISGLVLTSNLPGQYLYSGANRFMYVYTNNLNPFVNGWANVLCRFVRPF